MNLQHILVVIEPDSDEQPALARATDLAKLADCRLELMLADHSPYLEDGFYFDPMQAKELRQQHGERRLTELENIAEPLRNQGLEISCTTAWGNPAHDEIIARINSSNPSLVIKATRHHNKVARLLLSNSDWELIRHCAAPLMLVKTEPWQSHPKILAAVDPYHVHDKPASLDNKLIAESRYLAELAEGEVHLFHSNWVPPLSGVYALVHDVQLDIDLLHKLAESNSIAESHCHWSSDEIVKSLPETVEQLGINLVVMGAMSRSRLDEFLLGNTAERVLDSLECDVLLFRPDN
ncbi:MAG: universal stress protein [Pseudomonadales bacterium]|nr:universal stress protein [Pseudomonadales bacterium]